jgi:hypothetical protein
MQNHNAVSNSGKIETALLPKAQCEQNIHNFKNA